MTLLVIKESHLVVHPILISKGVNVNEHWGNIILKLKNERVRVIVFYATFNDISVTSWWSVLLVEETRVLPKENLRPVASPLQTISLKVVTIPPCLERDSNSQH